MAESSGRWRVYAVSLDLTFTIPRVVFMAQKGDGELRLRECIRRPNKVYPFIHFVNKWLALDQVWARVWPSGWTVYPKEGVKRAKTLRVQ